MKKIFLLFVLSILYEAIHAQITSAEYFIDADPGVGNAIPISGITPGDSVNFTVTIPTTSLTNGPHNLAIRTKDATGKWGLFQVSGFTITGALPLQLLSFIGQKNNSKVDLNWKTNNETNTSHFDVERSSNGIAFDKIGTVNAFNSSGNHDYLFIDVSPGSGLNFYRLKQVDIDNKSVYSAVLKILFTNSEDDVTIFPNPVNDILNISFAKQQTRVFISLFDNKGLLIKSQIINASTNIQLSTVGLAAGNYWLRISDGSSVKTKSFIVE